MANDQKEHSLHDVRQALADSLKKKIEEHTKHLIDLRKREETVLAKKSPPAKYKDLPEELKDKGYSADKAFAVAWSQRNKHPAGKVKKDEMGNGGRGYSGNGGAESAFGGGGGSVALNEKAELGKNAFGGYGPQTPGVEQSEGGGMPSGGTGAMEMTAKTEMCKACGEAHPPGQHKVAKAADTWDPASGDTGKVRGSVLAQQRPAAPPAKKSPKDIRGVVPEKYAVPTAPHLAGLTAPPPQGCPTCAVPGERLGKVAGREHFKCLHCGNDYSLGTGASALKSETVEDKTAPGAVLPGDKAWKKVSAPGSGGQIKKGKVAKAESPQGGAERLVKAVSGTAPTMMDMRPRLPGMGQKPAARRVAPNLPGIQAPPVVSQSPMHPETAGALQDVRGIPQQKEGQKWASQQANVAQLRQGIEANRNKPAAVPQVNQELKQFRSLASGGHGVKAPGSASGVGAAASTSAKGAGQSPIGAASAAFPSSTAFRDAKQGAAPGSAMTPDQQLKADMKAGGVGWLNSLVAKFRGAKFPAAGTGAGPSQMSPNRMAAGRAALARNEVSVSDLRKSLGDCPFCAKAEHLGECTR